MDAWQIYLDEFRRRAGSADRQRFGRQETMTEAAHDAYQATADRMTNDHGWNDEHTLVVMRGLNGAVQRWLELGGGDWRALETELRRREGELRDGFGGDEPASARP
jgi:hypothetical protein